MKILGIESSSLVASVAVVTDQVMTAEYTVNFKKTHSQTLLPMLDQVAEMIDLDLNTIDAIAVSGGPGSFTGLRIGAARRNQVYTGIYSLKNGFCPIMAQCPADIKELAEKLNNLGEKAVFLGDGVPVYKDILKAEMKAPYEFAPAHMNRQRAGAVAALGAVYYQEGKVESAAEHRPDYLRKSQAERERAGEEL